MYFDDLSPYKLFSQFDVDGFLNIGWLDDLHEYHKGVVQPSIVEKLRQILLNNRDVNPMRGIHGCAFCGADEIYLHFLGKKKLLGMSEIWIPTQSGIIYAAPSLLYHYIVAHQYHPPQEFLDAVENFDLASDWDGKQVFEAVLNRK